VVGHIMAKAPEKVIEEAIEALQATRTITIAKGGCDCLGEIEALTAKLAAHNAANADHAVHPMGVAVVTYRSGKDFNEKPGGRISLTFKAKPNASDGDLGKLTGRIKAIFMGVPKEFRYKMTPTTTVGPDGIKRWSIEVIFPYGTLEKINEKLGANPTAAAGIQQFKDYLEKSPKDAAPTTTSFSFECHSSMLAVFQHFDPDGKVRQTAREKAGPAAEIPKQVAALHAEILEHIDAVDVFELATPERQLTVNLPCICLSDIFSEPSGAATVVDINPLKEMAGALVLGGVGGARFGAPEKDLAALMTEWLNKILDKCPTKEAVEKFGAELKAKAEAAQP